MGGGPRGFSNPRYQQQQEHGRRLDWQIPSDIYIRRVRCQMIKIRSRRLLRHSRNSSATTGNKNQHRRQIRERKNPPVVASRAARRRSQASVIQGVETCRSRGIGLGLEEVVAHGQAKPRVRVRGMGRKGKHVCQFWVWGDFRLYNLQRQAGRQAILHVNGPQACPRQDGQRPFRDS